uniref:electron transport complex subunit RsxC n=1 Tax=Thaumasiovibrio occultus TaxID=1891184 RepID=UPI000B357835|nr:electron transport complex subunit RsxC [Thaumasiovibrio occultus]
MLSIIEKIKTGALWGFRGGIHPPENKLQSNQTPICRIGVPDELIIPLKQHIGSKGDICVNVGDVVLRGQPLTQADMAMCVPVHAPTSGTVVAIEERTIAHPSGLSDLCVIIRPDGDDRWTELHPIEKFRHAQPTDLVDKIRLSGISGMGGAGFPTSRKLQNALGKTEMLIINAAECEPYITADDRLMQDCAAEVLEGIRVLAFILKPALTVLAIEDNKPEAIKALQAAIVPEDQVVIRVIPTKYPSGGEKQLIKIVTGLEVPKKGLPSDIGIVMQNVGTAYAIKRAIINGEPITERVVTVTGDAVADRGNVWARIGTPVSFLLNHGNFQAMPNGKVILGGPMMGFTLPHTNVPVTKTVNCVLAPSKKELNTGGQEMPCIRCSACAEACPVSLLPQQLQWYAKDKDYDKCEEYNLSDCIECGACAYVCPSEIPLVQYYRQAKAEIRERDTEAQKSERAKERFEAKKARMERDKEERENRHKTAAADRRASMKTGDGDAIAAAIARVKAQKEGAAPSNEPKPAVAAAIARAKAKQAALQAEQQGETNAAEPDNSEMIKLREERKRLAREKKAAKAAEQASSDTAESPEKPSGENKKDAVAAAIARAKARKAVQSDDTADVSTSDDSAATDADPKKAAVAAAIARAKARKAAQSDDTSDASASDDSAAADADPKKAAVAAAIARAKARKATQSDDTTDASASDDSAAADADPKKAAVAAAIARAKARKAAQSDDTTDASARDDSAAADADPKKAAVAAAIARAKARKAAQSDDTTDTSASDDSAATDADPKKAAVAAAIARAKARKAAQQPAPEAHPEASQTAEVVTETVESHSGDEIDPKKAAVAAAIARAKARKAAQQAKNEEE